MILSELRKNTNSKIIKKNQYLTRLWFYLWLLLNLQDAFACCEMVFVLHIK